MSNIIKAFTDDSYTASTFSQNQALTVCEFLIDNCTAFTCIPEDAPEQVKYVFMVPLKDKQVLHYALLF